MPDGTLRPAEKRALRAWLLVVGLILGCVAAIGSRAEAQPGATETVAGRVTDEQGRPIGGARVVVNQKETVTKDDGAFALEVAGAERFILTISHPDFADLSSIFRAPSPKRTWRLVRAQIESIDPRTAITLVDRRPELKRKGIQGATFAVSANSLVDDQGRRPAGPIRAAIATLDVANGEGPGDWGVRSPDGRREGYLVSYGAVFVQFTDQTGKVRYQLRRGGSGQLTLPTIPSMLKHTQEAAQARFWYYDTADGYWKQTGVAKLNATRDAYVGRITHLSTLNTDIAKFDNAACLKVTLAPSVPVGNKLRIRYHSGGTPFGQTPTFVLTAVDNAAYRLPATTNVLVELLDAADQAFGNLVVQDPPGTPLVNNVVNTGPALAPGSNLWPPPPYATCKPIVLALPTPEVETRINEMPTDDAAKDNPSDDYVTWAPTFCRMRLTSPMASAVTVVLTNDAPGAIPGGGDVRFAAFASPWPANTTATAATLSLTLPADGSWVSFVIAGRFGTPSTNDRDTIIEVHQGTAGGTVIGKKALMVRVRKNANTLTPSERSRFLLAFRGFRNRLGANYVRFQEMHRLASTAGDEAHHQPAFLSWHRAMLLEVERELQKIDPSVSLHYWNWDAASPNVFTQDFMGAPGAGFGVAEPVFAVTNPLRGWNTDLPFSGGELRRNTDDHTLQPIGLKPLDHPIDDSLIDLADYGLTTPGFPVNSFSDDVEKRAHDLAHGWPCGGGHLAFPVRSAADPLFYLLHSQIDREWAYWQQRHNRLGVVVGGALTFPAPAHYDNTGAFNTPGNTPDADFRQKGSYLDDGLWPWDGTTGGAAMTVEQRPINQAPPGANANIPASRPLIPSTAFPASVQRNLWPSAVTVPRNAHMIDYLGRFRPADGLGFCYDDVPF